MDIQVADSCQRQLFFPTLISSKQQFPVLAIMTTIYTIDGGARRIMESKKKYLPKEILHQIASRLKGHLLLVHGDIDNNVHPGNTTRVVDALIKAGKRFDMLVLPEQRHGFGPMNEYFYWRMVDYFSEHLKGRKEGFIDIPELVR